MAGPSLLGGIIEQRLAGDFALGLSARLGHCNLAKAGTHTVVAAGNMCGDAGRIVDARHGAATIAVANHHGFVGHRNVL